jgi:hypothetical protein
MPSFSLSWPDVWVCIQFWSDWIQLRKICQDSRDYPLIFSTAIITTSLSWSDVWVCIQYKADIFFGYYSTKPRFSPCFCESTGTSVLYCTKCEYGDCSNTLKLERKTDSVGETYWVKYSAASIQLHDVQQQFCLQGNRVILQYKNQSVNTVQENTRCSLWGP